MSSTSVSRASTEISLTWYTKHLHLKCFCYIGNFTEKAQLTAPFGFIYRDPESKATSYLCNFCNHITVSHQEFMQHSLSHVVQCGSCNYKAFTRLEVSYYSQSDNPRRGEGVSSKKIAYKVGGGMTKNIKLARGVREKYIHVMGSEGSSQVKGDLCAKNQAPTENQIYRWVLPYELFPCHKEGDNQSSIWPALGLLETNLIIFPRPGHQAHIQVPSRQDVHIS